ncbi:MAG: M3 family oligoendopeptidase [Chloroflexi bacterium]|nr:MAG: M3 family oligoendopeptidase [Chloroflexota bacterium]TMF79396.1 MAG: M3 family oligoendopeptidase [Chloroflexota bacterium]
MQAVGLTPGGCASWPSGYPEFQVAQALKMTGAEDVRWNLSDLFASPDDPKIEAALARDLERAKAFEATYKGKVATLEPKPFAAMMRELADYEESSTRAEVYAYMLHSENTQDNAAGRLLARVREASAERGSHMVFFALELAQITDEHAAKLYADPESAIYRHTVDEARKFRPHQLSEPEERVLTDFSPVGSSSWVRLFEELCARIRVEVDGRDLALDQALTLLREPDREVRRQASAALTQALSGDLRTRGYIFNVILQEKAIDDRLRHFPTWISSRNLANETSDEAVQALVDAVTGRYDVCVRYYRVKRKLLNVGDLHEWDRYAPVSDTTRDLTWDDAKELVLGSYYRFSKRAGSQVEEFFKNSWIDAPVVPGKAGGAYCMPVTPRHHPYVLLNFTGKLRDALVLAHELGHGLHDRLASKQHIFDYHPPLTLAETASVFGEALTFDRIMAEEKDPKVRLALLCGQCEDAFSTVFRQVAFNRYEDASHNRRRTEGELSVEELGEMFQEKLQPMFGDALILTEEHKVWWSYVGHFLHTPGYVYAYAFGNLLALSVYHRYLERGEEFVEQYLEFLAAGGSTRPDELVKRIGMDITNPDFWDAGLKILDGMVTEVEGLSGIK